MKKIIDFRSDTVTKPTNEMRKAMMTAPVGDDVIGEDPTVNELEKLAAETVGKQAALFVPSGTFGNQLAILTHINRGSEVIISEDAHIVQYEGGAAAIISSAHLRTIRTERGWFNWNDIKYVVRESKDIHYPDNGLIVLQNSLGNGDVMPNEAMAEIKENALKYKIPVHVDGARLFNAALALNVSVKELARYADSVMFCLSKGLCSPIGSILAGSKDFIEKARYKRKLMGGGMRQAGVIAAPGIISINKMTKRLNEDHENAQKLAFAFSKYDIFNIDPTKVVTNIFYLAFNKDVSLEFYEFLSKNGVLTYPPRNGEIRFVTHNDVSKSDVDFVISIIPKFKN